MVKLVVIAACVSASAVMFLVVFVLGAHALLATAVAILLLALIYISIVPALNKVSRILESQKLFASNIAHELRGPMSVMQLDGEAALHNLSLIQLTEIKSKELISAVKSDLEGLRQMSNIIKNLSILVSQEYSTEKPEFKKIDLNVILQRICIVAEKQYGYSKNIEIQMDNTTPAYIMGNESALEQIVMNLLRNAIKYSPAGTTVLASTLSNRGGTALSICDQGIGISDHDLPHILSPFYRAQQSGSPTTNEKGTGLGLTIVAALAKQHKAIMTIASVLKKGTTVTLNFPLISQGV